MAVVVLVAEPLDLVPVLAAADAQQFQAGQVVRLLGEAPDGGRQPQIERPVIEPALIAVAIRDAQRAVAHLAVLQQPVDLAAREVEVAVVAGQQRRVAASDDGGHAQAVEAVRPAPAVKAAVPLAVVILADLAGEADVVRHQAAVLLGALDPCLGVLDHPLAVLLLAGEAEGVGDETGDRQVGRDIAQAHPVGHRLAHPAGELRVAQIIVVGDVGDVVEGQAVGAHARRPVEGGLAIHDAPARSAAAVVRGAHQLQARVVVAGLLVLVQVEAGEAAGAIAVGRSCRAARQRK